MSYLKNGGSKMIEKLVQSINNAIKQAEDKHGKMELGDMGVITVEGDYFLIEEGEEKKFLRVIDFITVTKSEVVEFISNEDENVFSFKELMMLYVLGKYKQETTNDLLEKEGEFVFYVADEGYEAGSLIASKNGEIEKKLLKFVEVD